MPTTCTFELDRLDPVYNSGEFVKGRLLLTTKKVKRVNAIYVSLEGEANVQWAISGKETASYFGHQQYLYTRASVSDNNFDFRAGTHIYVFNLRIPRECPSSCSGPYGCIGYNISLVIDRPHCFNEVFRQPIYVVQTLNLNSNPDFALSVRAEEIKYLCQWPCSSGALCFSLSLPYAGYVSGQYIIYNLEIDNQSPHYDVWSIEASLKQHFVFLARKPLKRNYHTKTLSKSFFNERTLRLTKRLYRGTLLVPQNTPRSTLNLNYIVFLHYTLQLKLKTGTLHYDASVSVPVVIGTEPLEQFLDEQRRLQQDICHSSDENGNRPTTVISSCQVHRQIGNGLITIQPTARIPSTSENVNNLDKKATISEELPPTYESCLPPSFSFATLKQGELNLANRQHRPSVHDISVHLPPFPGHSILKKQPQIAEDALPSSYLTERIPNSYGSLLENNVQCRTVLENVLEHSDNETDSSDSVYEIEES